MATACLHGPPGRLLLLREAGNQWKTMGHTCMDDGVELAGPSRRCFNACEGAYLVARGWLAVVPCPAVGAELDAPLRPCEALRLLAPHYDARVLTAYSELKARGAVVRFPHPFALPPVLHLHSNPATFKFSRPAAPDAVVTVCRCSAEVCACESVMPVAHVCVCVLLC